MANKIKELWTAGKVPLNLFLTIPNAFSAELAAQSGFDVVTCDMQHGLHDYASTLASFQAMKPHPVVPMARVPWYEPGIIGKVLDAGAYGIICPMVNTAADCEAFVSACRYPPAGKRSSGPIRVGMYDAGYNTTANTDVLTFAMIETQEALDNLDGILDVPSLDAIYIGPNDLAWSLGGLPPGLDREEPHVHKIFDRLIKESGKRGVRAALHCGTPAYAVRAIEMGFTFVTVGNESGLMHRAARAAAEHVRKGANGKA